MKVAQIQRVTADAFGLGIRDLRSRTQLPHIARPRMAAMFLSKRRTGHSNAHLGRLFDRDPTTVRHAVERVEQFMAADPEFAAKLREIEERL